MIKVTESNAKSYSIFIIVIAIIFLLLGSRALMVRNQAEKINQIENE